MTTVKERTIRAMLIIVGTVSLALGLIGIFVPVLPTTPFLLLAAACYARGSLRFYRWLIQNRLFGAYIRNYREGKGLPIKLRAPTLNTLWITIGLTAILFVDALWIRVLLLVIAVAVTWHVATLRPKVSNLTE